jgi:hypothetical protein
MDCVAPEPVTSTQNVKSVISFIDPPALMKTVRGEVIGDFPISVFERPHGREKKHQDGPSV